VSKYTRLDMSAKGEYLSGAGFAGLFLLLTVIATLPPGSSGFLVHLPRSISPEDCGDSRTIVVHVSNANPVRLNSEPITKATLGERLTKIYRLRAERVLFVGADP